MKKGLLAAWVLLLLGTTIFSQEALTPFEIVEYHPQHPILFVPTEEALAQMAQQSLTGNAFIDANEGFLEVTLALQLMEPDLKTLTLQFCLVFEDDCLPLLSWDDQHQAYSEFLTTHTLQPSIPNHLSLHLKIPHATLQKMKAAFPTAQPGVSPASLPLRITSPDRASMTPLSVDIYVVNLSEPPSHQRVETSRLNIASYNNSWGKNFNNSNFGVRLLATVNNKGGNKSVFYRGRNQNFKFTERSILGDVYVKVFGREFRILRGTVGAKGFHQSEALSHLERSIRTVGNILLWGAQHSAQQWFNYCQFNNFKDSFKGGTLPDASDCEPNKYSDGQNYRHEVGHSSTFIIVNIPVTVEGFVGGEVGVQWYLLVDQDHFNANRGMLFETLTGGGGAYILSDARVGVFVNLGAVQAGVQGLLSILDDELNFVSFADVVQELNHGFLRNFQNGPRGSTGPFVRYVDPSKTCMTQQCENVPYVGTVCVNVPYPCPQMVMHYKPLVSWSAAQNWNFLPFGFKCNPLQGCFGNFTNIHLN